MFKKIFHTSAVGKPEVDPKVPLTTDSSVSEESETIKPTEVPKPEKRFFLRRPSRIRPQLDETSSSYFRTFDPFDIKSSIRRSSSFPFKAKLEEPDSSTLRLPRSKSVHFAENLTTYHEFKPDPDQDFENFETTFEEFRRLRNNEAAGESESEESSEDREEEEVRQDQAGEAAQSEGEEKGQTQKDQDQTEDEETAAGKTQNGTQKNKGMKLAGQNLQSVFGGLEETCDGSKMLGFDNSDSTDVDSLGEVKRDKETEFLHGIYEQLCDLREIKANELADFDIFRLRSEVQCAIADVGDKISESSDQLEQSNNEVRKLRGTLQQASHELDTQISVTNKMKSLVRKSRDVQEVVQEKNKQIFGLEEKIAVLEHELAEAREKCAVACNNTKAQCAEIVSTARSEAAALHKTIAEIKSAKDNDEFRRHEKDELVVQLNQARKETQDLALFQEAEKNLIQEQCSKFQAQVELLERENIEKTSRIDNMESSLKAHKVAKDQQLNEASIMIKEIGKRYEEKKTQIQKISENLEGIRRLSERPTSSQSEPSQKRRPVLIHSKQASSEFQLATDIVGNIQRNIAISQTREAARARQLGELAASNKIAMESLVLLIKANFEALAPIFHQQSAEQFRQMYYEFSKQDVLTEDNKGVVMVLCNFILNAQRELLRQHAKNEQMLETEIQDRLKYQQQVLDSFTRIVRQVMEASRGPRASGIRGHSSPKKSKVAYP